jgi:hypothetical protein
LITSVRATRSASVCLVGRVNIIPNSTTRGAASTTIKTLGGGETTIAVQPIAYKNMGRNIDRKNV